MSTFQEYPKRMSHPRHAPAVWKQLEGKGVGLFAPDTICTSPERFPEVTVYTKEQEQQYAARGYRPNNVPDPAAYEQALLEMRPVADYTNNAYPKWKYHAMEIPVIVKSEQEEASLGDGWGDAPIIATEDDLPVMEAESNEEEEVVVDPVSPAVHTVPKKPKAKYKPKSTARAKQSRVSKSAHA